MMRWVGAVMATLLCLLSPVAQADEFPSRPITLVVPLPAGSGTDAVARVVAAYLADEIGAKIVVDNKVGANGAIGSTYVARATPDGYTILIGGTTTHAANPSLMKNVTYNPVTDFVPLGQIGMYPYALYVSGKSPYRTLAELLADAKAKPGTLSIAYANALGQLSGELLRKRMGLDTSMVPYRGSSQAITDIIGGRVTAMFTDFPTAISQLEPGNLRAIAVTTEQRTALMPSLPTLAEAGFAGPRVEAWSGLFVPAGTPDAITEKLSKGLLAVMAKPEVVAKLAAMGFEAKSAPPAAFRQRVADDGALWAKLTKETGIEAQ
jgi:tripartite-type tricarboxylate transporter receptor subunit TctC